MILADTSVVSEFMKEAPDPVVMEWAHGVDPRDLEHRWGQLLDSFCDSVAVYDVTAARRTASILAAAEASGRPMSLADAQIAGICLAGGYQLATRNVSGFSTTAGLTTVDPFDR